MVATDESDSISTEIRPGLEDVPVARSAISFIDGKNAQLEYRGISVETLARESSFEETTWLLFKGELPTESELAAFQVSLKERRNIGRLEKLLETLPLNGHPMHALQSAIAAVAMYGPNRGVNDPEFNWQCAVNIVAKMPTIVAAFHRLRLGYDAVSPRKDLDHAANFYWMLFEREPAPAVHKVLDACLILHAEHEMNASTFSGRVTGSTLACPYSVVSAAVGTLTGPLHGGANEEVLDILREIGNAEGVRGWLGQKRAIDPKFKIMGMGHRVYKVKDPRATLLQALGEQAFAESGVRPLAYDVALELERVAEPIYGPKGVYPNVDFYSGIIYEALGIPKDLMTPIFAIARSAGWLAHWMEQLQDNRIYRPKQIYVGKRGTPYVPASQRMRMTSESQFAPSRSVPAEPFAPHMYVVEGC